MESNILHVLKVSVLEFEITAWPSRYYTTAHALLFRFVSWTRASGGLLITNIFLHSKQYQSDCF